MKVEQCKKCEYGYRFTAGDYRWYIGCKYPPYHGRWCAEIKQCPKENAEKEGFKEV